RVFPANDRDCAGWSVHARPPRFATPLENGLRRRDFRRSACVEGSNGARRGAGTATVNKTSVSDGKNHRNLFTVELNRTPSSGRVSGRSALMHRFQTSSNADSQAAAASQYSATSTRTEGDASALCPRKP